MWALRCVFCFVNAKINWTNIPIYMSLLNLVNINFELFWLSSVDDISHNCFVLLIYFTVWSLRWNFVVRMKCFLGSPHGSVFLREMLSPPHLSHSPLPCPFFSLSSSFLQFLKALPRVPHLRERGKLFFIRCGLFSM